VPEIPFTVWCGSHGACLATAADADGGVHITGTETDIVIPLGKKGWEELKAAIKASPDGWAGVEGTYG
jgi:hypothetical protein